MRRRLIGYATVLASIVVMIVALGVDFHFVLLGASLGACIYASLGLFRIARFGQNISLGVRLRHAVLLAIHGTAVGAVASSAVFLTVAVSVWSLVTYGGLWPDVSLESKHAGWYWMYELRTSPEMKHAMRYVLIDAGMQVEPEHGVEAFREALSTQQDPTERFATVMMLAEFGADASAAVAELGQVLQDESPLVRCAAAYAIGEIGVTTELAMADLRAALNDPVEVVRVIAAEALLKSDPNDRGAATALEMGVDSSDPITRTAAQRVTRRLDPLE